MATLVEELVNDIDDVQVENPEGEVQEDQRLVATADERDFIPAPRFTGPRAGFEFKKGKEGLGYYRTGAVAPEESKTTQLTHRPPISGPAAVKAASDGVENRERWHWKERDLRDWLTEWLVEAFMTFDGGLLFEGVNGISCRVTTVRGDFSNGEDGTALLHWRKGKCFATFNFAIRFEYQCVVKVGDRTIGQAKGVVWVRDINSEDNGDNGQAQDATPPGLSVEGAWEKPPPGQTPNEHNVREPSPYEEQAKAQVQESGPEAVRQRIQLLRKCLDDITAADGKLTVPLEAARAALSSYYHPNATEGDHAPSDEHKKNAEEYVENLRRQHRSERHMSALEDTNLTDMRFNLLDLRPTDMPEVVEALQKNSVVTCLDLSTNDKLDDNALQPLLLALANRTAPTLKRLKLQGTSASIISKNMAKGLKLMRKDLEIEFD